VLINEIIFLYKSLIKMMFFLIILEKINQSP
jgi:hypothetical protein